jgi:hypothetical protein
MTSDNTALIAEMEAAEKGSRELSDRVLLALGYAFVPSKNVWRRPGDDMDYGGWLDPSESIDDALAMLPEGWRWRLELCRDGAFLAHLFHPNPTRHHIATGSGEGTKIMRGPNLCCVACAAILKAKEADNER